MKRLLMALLLLTLPGVTLAGPVFVEVTATALQPHIEVSTAHLGEGFWAFTVQVDGRAAEIPGDLSASLIVRDVQEHNLLSTLIKPSYTEDNRVQFYAALHEKLPGQTRIHLRDNMTVYVIRLESFRQALEER